MIFYFWVNKLSSVFVLKIWVLVFFIFLVNREIDLKYVCVFVFLISRVLLFFLFGSTKVGFAGMEI